MKERNSKKWFERNFPKLSEGIKRKPLLSFLDGSIKTRNSFFPYEQNKMENKASIYFDSNGFAKGKINLKDNYGSKYFKMIMN